MKASELIKILEEHPDYEVNVSVDVSTGGNDASKYEWEWFNNVQGTGWETISPSYMDAIIAHGLKPQPQFRKIQK